MKLLDKFRGPRRARSASTAETVGPVFTAQPEPAAPFFVIGDIHGCLQQLGDLLLEIEKREEVPQVICVGDMIDRGEHSAGVLRLLRRLNGEFGELVTCIKGNHEAMMLDFIDDPEKHGGRWLRNGGLQTLASFRIGRGANTSHAEVRDALVEALGVDMIDWLQGLPLTWQSGNVVVVHAGADPKLPLDMQASETLLWGSSDFSRVSRSDGMWVVHGHTIVRDPAARLGRISIDTGAYATGRLSAAYIRPGRVTFLQSGS